MRSRIADHKESLWRRVALLKSVPESALHGLFASPALNPGVEAFVSATRGAGLKTLLVSGGVTFFSDRIRERLKLDYTRSNVLEVTERVLTGRMIGQLGATRLREGRMVKQVCDERCISTAQAIAVGEVSTTCR